MRKMTVSLAFAATAALITVVVMSMASNAVSMYAQARPVSSYAEDRAEIEDLQAQYLLALDFHDPDLYVSTFTQDGVLDYGSGEVKGREAIKDVIARMHEPGHDGRTSTRSRSTQHLEYPHQGRRQQSSRALVLVPLLQRQPATQGRLRRVRAL
jgi:hypothetical protein